MNFADWIKLASATDYKGTEYYALCDQYPEHLEYLRQLIVQDMINCVREVAE